MHGNVIPVKIGKWERKEGQFDSKVGGGDDFWMRSCSHSGWAEVLSGYSYHQALNQTPLRGWIAGNYAIDCTNESTLMPLAVSEISLGRSGNYDERDVFYSSIDLVGLASLNVPGLMGPMFLVFHVEKKNSFTERVL